MAQAADMQVQHPVMDCPVCEETILADVTVKPELGTPTVAMDGWSVNLPVDAKIIRFNLSHRCWGRAEEATNEEPPA